MSQAKSQIKHEVVHQLRQGSILVTITQHIFQDVPRYSFSMQKEYERQNETKKSHWFDKRHLSDLRLAIEAAEAWMQHAEDHGRAAKRDSVDGRTRASAGGK